MASLEKDLKEVVDFFNFHKKTNEGFAEGIQFETRSNSYVRILKENIEKIDFPVYDVHFKITELVNSDDHGEGYRKYKLKVSFERTY